MNITKRYVKDGKNYNCYDEEIITCTLCNIEKTTMLGTKRCDRCYELEWRVKNNIALTKKILALHDKESSL